MRDLLAHGAEQQAGEAAVAAGAEHQEVGVLRDVDEHGRGRPFHGLRLDLDLAGGAADLLDLLLDEALGVAPQGGVEVRRDEHGVERIRRKRGVVRPRMHGDQLRPAEARLADRQVDRLAARIRAVDADDDLPGHAPILAHRAGGRGRLTTPARTATPARTSQASPALPCSKAAPKRGAATTVVIFMTTSSADSPMVGSLGTRSSERMYEMAYGIENPMPIAKMAGNANAGWLSTASSTNPAAARKGLASRRNGWCRSSTLPLSGRTIVEIPKSTKPRAPATPELMASSAVR